MSQLCFSHLKIPRSNLVVYESSFLAGEKEEEEEEEEASMSAIVEKKGKKMKGGSEELKKDAPLQQKKRKRKNKIKHHWLDFLSRHALHQQIEVFLPGGPVQLLGELATACVGNLSDTTTITQKAKDDRGTGSIAIASAQSSSSSRRSIATMDSVSADVGGHDFKHLITSSCCYFRITLRLLDLVSPLFLTRYMHRGGSEGVDEEDEQEKEKKTQGKGKEGKEKGKEVEEEVIAISQDCPVDHGPITVLLAHQHLYLSIDAATYASLGLQGKASVFKPDRGRYNVSIDLSAPSFHTGGKYYDRVCLCLKQLENSLTLIMIVPPTASGSTTTIEDLGLLFPSCSNCVMVSQRLSTHTFAALITPIPAVQAFSSPSSLSLQLEQRHIFHSSVVDWLGLIACRFDQALQQILTEQQTTMQPDRIAAGAATTMKMMKKKKKKQKLDEHASQTTEKARGEEEEQEEERGEKNSDSSSPTTLANYISSFSCPHLPLLPAGQKCHALRIQGLLSVTTVLTSLEQARRLVKAQTVPFAVVSVWGFPDACQSWQDKEHNFAFADGGDNHYMFVVLPDDRYILYVLLSSMDLSV